MKQHITPAQLDELSPEGKEKLIEWWKPQDGDVYWTKAPTRFPEEYLHINVAIYHDRECCGGDFCDYSREDGLEIIPSIDCLPLLSIGQMIEFLGDEWNEKAQCFMVTNDGVVFPNIYCGNDCLCDYLWSAVKQVLEVNNG